MHSALEKLPASERTQLVEGILALEDEPLPDGHRRKKLAGVDPPLYRLREGRWRLLYRIEGRSVVVLDLIQRRDFEAWLRRWR